MKNPVHLTPAGIAPDLVVTADTPWIVAADEPEPVRRALEDVKRDWYKVFGHLPVVLSAPPVASWNGPLIHLGLAANSAPHNDVISPAMHGREAFVLGVRASAAGRPVILATGADPRGAIYAAYAFSEEILGVDPWWFWTDQEPTFRASIAVAAAYNLPVAAPTFKHRGWFINDEDLLNGFSPDPLRENAFSNDMLDRICETLLRLRGNMLVPATFPFPDERCHELTARRGLIIAQHHILVMGLNTYQWPKDIPFSFSRHPEIVERYWQTCVDAFKGKEVVWSVGYRGKFDRPFWVDEPEIATPQARGEVISRAIAKQVEIIRRAQPDAAIIANMWDEGAKLYRQGVITLPPGVALVWPDDGTGLMRENGQNQSLGPPLFKDAAMRNSLTGAIPSNLSGLAEAEPPLQASCQP
ncbi:MAG: glycosyl hydrolase 115 family protein, partial [Opitutaceae bacterium]